MKNSRAEHTVTRLAAPRNEETKTSNKEECISRDKKRTTGNDASQIDNRNVINASS